MVMFYNIMLLKSVHVLKLLLLSHVNSCLRFVKELLNIVSDQRNVIFSPLSIRHGDQMIQSRRKLLIMLTLNRNLHLVHLVSL